MIRLFLKSLSVLSVLMAVLALSSCDTVLQYPDEPETETEVPTPDDPVQQCLLHLTFDTSDMPLHTIIDYDENGNVVKSRSTENPHDFRYLIKIYRNDSRADDTPIQPGTEVWQTISMIHEGEDYDLDCTVPIELPEGYYRIYIWGDFVTQGTVDDYYYDTTEFSSITIMDDENGVHRGNCIEREAFRGETEIYIETETFTKAIETIDLYADLERPMSRYRFIATDVDKFLVKMRAAYLASSTGDSKDVPQRVPQLDDYTTIIRYTSYMPSVYNLILDRPVDSSTGRWYNGSIVAYDSESAELGHDYVLVNHRESSVQVSLETYHKNTGELVSQTPSITVPLIRGHLTEIRGEFLSSKVEGGVGVQPDFDGDYNIVIR